MASILAPAIDLLDAHPAAQPVVAVILVLFPIMTWKEFLRG